jgi:hypothetical protein
MLRSRGLSWIGCPDSYRESEWLVRRYRVMNKKLILPFIVFPSILVINVASLVSGIRQHEIWRIAVASIHWSLFLLLPVLL